MFEFKISISFFCKWGTANYRRTGGKISSSESAAALTRNFAG